MQALALLEAFPDEDAIFDHVTAQLRPLLAAGDEAGVRRWYRVAAMIDRITQNHLLHH